MLTAFPRAPSEEELTLTRENSIRRLHSSHSTDTRTQVGGWWGAQGRGSGVMVLGDGWSSVQGDGASKVMGVGVPWVMGWWGVQGDGVSKVMGVG